MAPIRGANPFGEKALRNVLPSDNGLAFLSQSGSMMPPNQQTGAQQPGNLPAIQSQNHDGSDTSTGMVQNQTSQPRNQRQYAPLIGYGDPEEHTKPLGRAVLSDEEFLRDIDKQYEDVGIPNSYTKQVDTSGLDNSQLAHMQCRKMPDAAALPTAALASSFDDSNNSVLGPYNKATIGVRNGAQPTSATRSNGAINPAIYQNQGTTVIYSQPNQGSLLRSDSPDKTRAEAQPKDPAPRAPDGQQVMRTALSNINVNANRSVPSVNPMQQAYFNAPSAQWIMEEGQQLIKLSFEDAKKLHHYVLNNWHQWPAIPRDFETPPLFTYVSRGSQNLQYTVPSNSMLGHLLTPQASGASMFGQQPPSAQHPSGDSGPSKGPAKTAPKKGGRGRPRKQAKVEEDQTRVDMMDYHGPAKTRRFPVQSNYVQQPQATVVQPGSMQIPGYQQPPQASPDGTLRGSASTEAAPAIFPTHNNDKSRDFNGQARGLQQPFAVEVQDVNGAHLGTNPHTLANDSSASHQRQHKVGDFATSAFPSSSNDRKRSREVNEAEPNILHEAKKARTTPSVSKFDDKGENENIQQKQKTSYGPSQGYNSDGDQPTVQVCIGTLDPKAAAAALNMALDAIRTGHALLKARPGDDALCVPHSSDIVCLPPNQSIAYYGPSNTIAAGRKWQEVPAVSCSAGWTAASRHHSLTMAGVPIQDIEIEVFDKRKHRLTTAVADPNPETKASENTAPISVDAPLHSSEGQQCPGQGQGEGDHRDDAAAHHSSSGIDIQRDDALPSNAISASYPENPVLSNSVSGNDQSITQSAGGPPGNVMDRLRPAVTRPDFVDAGATSNILDTIMNDPTIPNFEDLNAAGYTSNSLATPDLNSGGTVCLGTQDAPHQGGPVVPLVPAAHSDNMVPPNSFQDTAKEESEIAWDAHLREHYSGKPDDSEEPETAPADVAQRQVSVPRDEADDTNEEEWDIVKIIEAGYTNEDDDTTFWPEPFYVAS